MTHKNITIGTQLHKRILERTKFSSSWVYMLTVGGANHGNLDTINDGVSKELSGLYRGKGGAKRPVVVWSMLPPDAAELAFLSIDLDALGIYREDT